MVGATAGLIVLSPILAAVALALLATQGRPILFRQERPGRHAIPFRIAKFRTMRAPGPGEVAYLTDAQRVSRLGAFLRASSIDELPELWNVLRGEMSLVGPRPLLMEYLPSLHRATATSPRHASGRDELGGGQWPARPAVRRSDRARRVVRRALEP